MACDVIDFRLRFPEFSDCVEIPDGRIALFLNDASNLHIGIDEKRWQGKYNAAQCYLAAHLLSIALNTEVGDTSANEGGIASKSAGGVSVARSIVARSRGEMDAFYSSTSYGQYFIGIRNMVFAGPIVGVC